MKSAICAMGGAVQHPSANCLLATQCAMAMFRLLHEHPRSLCLCLAAHLKRLSFNSKVGTHRHLITSMGQRREVHDFVGIMRRPRYSPVLPSGRLPDRRT